jgi:hypothetical protein
MEISKRRETVYGVRNSNCTLSLVPIKVRGGLSLCTQPKESYKQIYRKDSIMGFCYKGIYENRKGIKTLGKTSQ